MRILVTGGLGFIGSHYVRTLLGGGYRGSENASVTVLDPVTDAGKRDAIPRSHPRLTFAHGNVLDRDVLSHVVSGQDAVVHFAAETHVDRSLTAATDFVRTNVEGTQRLLDACLAAGVRRVVQISTAEVYGDTDQGMRTERSALAPNSPYAASKAAADLLALSYFRTHRLGVSVTRCCNNYGPYQHPEKFIPRAITSLLEGRPVPIYGNGQQVREWLHVADHCHAVHQVLTSGRPGEIYNIGGGTAMTNLTVAHRLAELCGAEPDLIQHVTDRNGHGPRHGLDQTKLERELGQAPRIQFTKGLEQTVAWYQDNPQWWKAITMSGGRP
ncbi:MAG TPA: dTDP-glucose 4,6-dehydratase [Streptosporangiaceae bacterium]|nr:dTDP-glucose 4,6-dehydratase [Streptosporangiaceae bacterium]